MPPTDALPPLPLSTTRAVVTGASGGIGGQIAVALAAAGVRRMGIHYHSNLAGAKKTADRVASLGCEGVLLQADVAVRSQCAQLVQEAFSQLDEPQVWVLAAGADVLTGQAQNWTFEQKLQRLVEVDLLGSIHLGRMVASRLAQTAEARADDQRADDQRANDPCADPERSGAGTTTAGSIILIGWDQATLGMEGDAGQMFGPVKAGVEALGKSLAQQFAPWVRVNTIAPGWIRTAWGQGVSGYWDARARAQALLGRWGEPSDIAAAAVFLASPASGFITAQTIAVNGGFNRRWPNG